MTKLVAIFPLVVSFVVCVESFVLNNGMRSFQEANMFKSKGEKSVKYMGTVYPSLEIGSLGQVGGLDMSPDGSLFVFHRADRVWKANSFIGNNFNTLTYKEIKPDTIMKIDIEKMNKIGSWGSNMFYMPHGLTVDHEGKIWVTDVGLHQVFKFDENNMEKPELVLGERFRLGDDKEHFCKPTGVAVSQLNGHVFVSDGYCNKRVVEFDENGKFVKQFVDKEAPMIVVHSIALIDSLNLVCTVSREEGRIVCFDVKTGDKLSQITHKEMKTVYGITYDPINEVLHAATGENHGLEAKGLTFDASEKKFGQFIRSWSAQDRDLQRVHDLTTSPDGSRILLGQLNGEIDEMSFE